MDSFNTNNFDYNLLHDNETQNKLIFEPTITYSSNDHVTQNNFSYTTTPVNTISSATNNDCVNSHEYGNELTDLQSSNGFNENDHYYSNNKSYYNHTNWSYSSNDYSTTSYDQQSIKSNQINDYNHYNYNSFNNCYNNNYNNYNNDAWQTKPSISYSTYSSSYQSNDLQSSSSLSSSSTSSPNNKDYIELKTESSSTQIQQQFNTKDIKNEYTFIKTEQTHSMKRKLSDTDTG